MMKLSNMCLVTLSQIVLAITYTIVVFALFPNQNEAFYINYTFTMLSIIITLGVILHIFEKELPLRTLFYKFPLFSITILYAIGQLILSGVLLHNQTDTPWTIAINTLMLGVFLMSAISATIIHRFHIAIQDEPKDSNFIQDQLLLLMDIKQKITEKVLVKQLDTLEEVLRYSDPVSSNKVTKLEQTIREKIIDLRQDKSHKTFETKINTLIQLIEKRNTIIKNNK